MIELQNNSNASIVFNLVCQKFDLYIVFKLKYTNKHEHKINFKISYEITKVRNLWNNLSSFESNL